MIPSTTMFVKGKMTIERCLAHTTANKIKWMSSGEIDLMAAIVIFDGRFYDFCFVMPSCLCDSIAIPFAKFVEYQHALKMVQLGKTQNLDPITRPLLRLLTTTANWGTTWCNMLSIQILESWCAG
jgi:hypothetical protein